VPQVGGYNRSREGTHPVQVFDTISSGEDKKRLCEALNACPRICAVLLPERVVGDKLRLNVEGYEKLLAAVSFRHFRVIVLLLIPVDVSLG
jgi:hypothetical protein